MLINSRPLTYLPEKSDQIQIPKMLPAEQKALINTISEKATMYFSPHTVQKDLQSCLELPLFCILYAVLKGGGDFGWVKNKIDLLTAFVDKATKRIVEGDKVIYDDLVNLSIHATNRNYGDIHISEVTLQSSVDTILKTGLVEKQADYWSFPLAIVPQFLAAKALQLKKIDWQSVVASKEQIARWKYPLSILFSRASFDETFDLFAGVFCKAPGTAAQIISDGILTDRRESLPPAMECGKKLIQCMQLLQDDDVTKQKGVYEYLLSGKTKEKVLSIRAFTENEKRTMCERQNGICPMCAAEGKTRHWEIEEMHADHKIPWSRGGHTTLDNGQMLCRDHNLQKSDI